MKNYLNKLILVLGLSFVTTTFAFAGSIYVGERVHYINMNDRQEQHDGKVIGLDSSWVHMTFDDDGDDCEHLVQYSEVAPIYVPPVEPQDSYETCIENLDQNTGTACDDSKLAPIELSNICLMTNAAQISSCTIELDGKSNLTAAQSAQFCIENQSATVDSCVFNLAENTGSAHNDTALSVANLLSVCMNPNSAKLSSCIISLDANTSMTAAQALQVCLRGGE